MSLPGLLVEYLITGAVALLWIIVAVGSGNLHQLADIQLFILPAAYVVGMVIDFIAYVLTYIPKKLVRKIVINANNDGNDMDEKKEMTVRTKFKRNIKSLTPKST